MLSSRHLLAPIAYGKRNDLLLPRTPSRISNRRCFRGQQEHAPPCVAELSARCGAAIAHKPVWLSRAIAWPPAFEETPAVETARN